MAGTATDYNVAMVAVGHGQLWAGLAVPGAGASLTLDTDGTPDATANPNAIHMGMTAEGCELLVKPSHETYAADEFAAPIITDVGPVEAVISGSLIQVIDFDIVEVLLAGVGTKSVASGYENMTLGTRAMVYQSVALIFPLKADPAKFGVFHLYHAFNDQGLAMQIGRTKRAATPVAFRGLAIPGRAAADTIGKYWKQVAVA